MEKTYKPLLIDSIEAQTDLEKHRFIGFDGNYCASGRRVFGVIDENTSQGQLCPVATHGILLVKTAGPTTQGVLVQSNEEGYAVNYTAGVACCYALDSASGAGEIIRVLI